MELYSIEDLSKMLIDKKSKNLHFHISSVKQLCMFTAYQRSLHNYRWLHTMWRLAKGNDNCNEIRTHNQDQLTTLANRTKGITKIIVQHAMPNPYT